MVYYKVAIWIILAAGIFQITYDTDEKMHKIEQLTRVVMRIKI